MGSHQAHKRLREEKLFEGTGELFKQGLHNCKHLAERVTTFSRRRGDDLSRLQRAALHRYQNDTIYNLQNQIKSSTHDTEVIGAYFRLFDDLFFFGSLASRCQVFIDHKHSTHLGRAGKCSWFVKFPKPRFWKNHERHCRISLCSREDTTSNRYSRLKKYLSTLLHEMIHAFLVMWACDQRRCRKRIGNEGESGHGFAWLDIAFAVETAARDGRFLNLDLNLHRVIALGLELRKSGAGIPEDKLVRWNMSCESVARELKNNRGKGYCYESDSSGDGVVAQV